MPRDFEVTDFSSIVSLSRSLAETYRRRSDRPSVLIESDLQIQELARALEELSKTVGDDFPPELVELMADIKVDLERYKQRVADWYRKQAEPANRFLVYIPVLKPVLTSCVPALALYLATMPGGSTIVLLVVLILVAGGSLLFTLYPSLLSDFQDTWYAEDRRRFNSMKEKLERHIQRVQRLQAMQMQIRDKNRFDVSKVLTGEERAFWIKNFGADTYSVDISRFVETLLYLEEGGANSTKYKNEDRKLVYATMQQLVDQNSDTRVSPTEFLSLLHFFGPLSQVCSKVVNSLIDFSSKPPTVYSWFSWRSMDRGDVEEQLILHPVGTFVIRCSSQSGLFAVDYTTKADGKVKVRHSIVKNDPEKGYHFANTTRYFPDLHSLVLGNDSVLRIPYLDPQQPVHINVGGTKFQCTVGTFMLHPNTKLGAMFATPRRLVDEEPLFFDRDPGVFRVILNWYRYGELLIPEHISYALVEAELRYFNINISSPGLPTNRAHPSLRHALSERFLELPPDDSPSAPVRLPNVDESDETKQSKEFQPTPLHIPGPGNSLGPGPGRSGSLPSLLGRSPGTPRHSVLERGRIQTISPRQQMRTSPPITRSLVNLHSRSRSYSSHQLGREDEAEATGSPGPPGGTPGGPLGGPLKFNQGSLGKQLFHKSARQLTSSQENVEHDESTTTTNVITAISSTISSTTSIITSTTTSTITSTTTLPTTSTQISPPMTTTTISMLPTTTTVSAPSTPLVRRQTTTSRLHITTHHAAAPSTPASALGSVQASPIHASPQLGSPLSYHQSVSQRGSDSISNFSGLVLALDFERLPYWFFTMSREECIEALRPFPSGTYLLRGCFQKDEYIDGRPNPDLIVLSYMEDLPTSSATATTTGTTTGTAGTSTTGITTPPAASPSLPSRKLQSIKVYRAPGQGFSKHRFPTQTTTFFPTMHSVALRYIGPQALPISDHQPHLARNTPLILTVQPSLLSTPSHNQSSGQNQNPFPNSNPNPNQPQQTSGLLVPNFSGPQSRYASPTRQLGSAPAASSRTSIIPHPHPNNSSL